MHNILFSPRSSIGHTLPSSGTHVGLSSRSIDGSIVRSGNAHSSITIAKQVNISQPIVQHLQQQVRSVNHLKLLRISVLY